ncbi:PHB depolymerase family esterase [soil metagenome]
MQRAGIQAHMNYMRLRCFFGLLLIATLGGACNPKDIEMEAPTGTPAESHSMRVGNDERTYQIHVPQRSAPESGWPLVIVVHGLGSDASQMRALTGFDDLAEEKGFIAVYPDGLARAWLDAGISDRFSDTDIATRNLDFMEALVEELDREHGVDDRRIYMTGLSNGGMFAFHAACQMSDRLAAIGLVAAASISQSYDNCEPEVPVAYIAFHGTSDTVVPYEGGPVVTGFDALGEYQSAHEAAKFWAGINGCPANPHREDLPAI